MSLQNDSLFAYTRGSRPNSSLGPIFMFIFQLGFSYHTDSIKLDSKWNFLKTEIPSKGKFLCCFPISLSRILKPQWLDITKYNIIFLSSSSSPRLLWHWFIDLMLFFLWHLLIFLSCLLVIPWIFKEIITFFLLCLWVCSDSIIILA